MLDNTDKKWIEQTIDEKLDARFAEQDARLEETLDRRFAEQEMRIDQRFAEQNERLNKVIDERFSDAIESFERRINERFEAFEHRFMLLIENEVTPVLKIHAEVLPDTYKSYHDLEERVETLEINYDILKNAFANRL